MNAQQSGNRRRWFAAKRKHVGWGWFLLLVGVFGALPPIIAMVAKGDSFSSILMGSLTYDMCFVSWGIYLLRGPEEPTPVVPSYMDAYPVAAPPMVGPVPQPTTVVNIDLGSALNDLPGNNSGKSQMELLRELKNAHYERLISDEEFQAARARVLGIDQRRPPQ